MIHDSKERWESQVKKFKEKDSEYNSKVTHEQAKEFGVGAQILKDLGIKNINLITTNKETEFVGLAGFGLDVVEKVEVI